MNRIITLFLFLCFTAVPLSAQSYGTDYSQPGKKLMLSFKTMYGVNGLFLGETNPVRGVDGDELPWIIRSVRGKLFTDGRLIIHVRGLIFPNDPSVPEELRGINDEPYFRGLVSCLTEENGAIIEHNVITENFPATVSGNSDIIARVELPRPCVAPVVMVLAGSEDKWFSITGY
ncbi:MAG: hypothetical protein ACXWTN_08250 [Methylosarcina sp.]